MWLWIALGTLLVAVVLFFKFQGFRRFVFLSVLAALLGIVLGPPTYVVLEEHTARTAADNREHVHYFGWQINPLSPTSAKHARVGIYDPGNKVFRRLDQAQAAQVALPFVPPPGNSIWLHLWWWIFPVVYLGYWLLKRAPIVNLFGVATRRKELREALELAEAENTVWAFENVIKRGNQFRLKPKKVILAAEEGRRQVFAKYHRRLQLLEKASATAAQLITSNGQDQVQQQGHNRALAANRDFYRMLRELLNLRAASTQSGLPMDVSLAEGWYTTDTTFNNPTSHGSLSAHAHASAEEAAAYWHKSISDTVTLEQVYQAFTDQTESMAAMAERFKADNGQTAKVVAQYREFVTNYLRSQLPEANVGSAVYLATQHFNQKLFLQLASPTREGAYRRSFTKHLRDDVVHLVTSFFPEETYSDHGCELFDGSTNSSAAGLKFSIMLIPFSRRYSGEPTVGAQMVATDQYGTLLWERRLGSVSVPVDKKISGDAFGRLEAALLLKNSIQSPLSPSGKPQQVSAAQKRRLMDELNDAAKEVAKGTGEDIVLELINEALAGNAGSALQQYTGAIEADMDALYELAFEAATDMMLAGLSFLAGDD